ncbi:hypothetical protein D9758_009244 [Tetrapyrgos nigripes]|uniref:Uncharacterized protein n=1 Tax=Tetrapyrgos nigripes TaxID=182062 RepID=A0A8H5D1X3_9AGAR|nr:hypothetical protein D9758_009244 [Tetrapyrgos nigripes]
MSTSPRTTIAIMLRLQSPRPPTGKSVCPPTTHIDYRRSHGPPPPPPSPSPLRTPSPTGKSVPLPSPSRLPTNLSLFYRLRGFRAKSLPLFTPPSLSLSHLSLQNHPNTLNGIAVRQRQRQWIPENVTVAVGMGEGRKIRTVRFTHTTFNEMNDCVLGVDEDLFDEADSDWKEAG